MTLSDLVRIYCRVQSATYSTVVEQLYNPKTMERKRMNEFNHARPLVPPNTHTKPNHEVRLLNGRDTVWTRAPARVRLRFHAMHDLVEPNDRPSNSMVLPQLGVGFPTISMRQKRNNPRSHTSYVPLYKRCYVRTVSQDIYVSTDSYPWFRRESIHVLKRSRKEAYLSWIDI